MNADWEIVLNVIKAWSLPEDHGRFVGTIEFVQIDDSTYICHRFHLRAHLPGYLERRGFPSWGGQKRIGFSLYRGVKIESANTSAQYSEDLNTLREHIIKSESSYLFLHSTPAIVSLLLIFVRYTIGLQTGKFFELALRFIELILIFVLFIILIEIILTILLLVPSLLESRKVLNRFGINEKEEQFYKLFQNYFWTISGFK